MKKTIHAIALSLTLCLSIIPVSAQDSIPATDTTIVSRGSTESVESVEDVENKGSIEIVSAEEQSTMERLTAFCLDNLNYGTVALFMAIESSFVPFPSEAVVPPAAWKATVTGSMNIFLVVIFATLGAIIGALFNYFLALWLGRPIVYKFANSRIGHMCLIDEEKVKYAEQYFDEHGAVSTIIGRLVPAVRQLISIPAGLARMGLGRFLLYTTIGAGAWNIILAILGYWMSKIPGMDSEEAVMAAVKEHSTVIGYVFFALAAFIIVFLVYKGSKGGKK